MSTNIDKRIVEMSFDNKQFESGVKDSLQSIENLKKGLEFDKVTSNLENIAKKLGSLSLDALESGVSSISSKFSLLGSIGVEAIQRISNAVVNLGQQMVNSFTIEPIKTGLSEYETKIDAIQTILSNTRAKGTTLDDVTATLDELNTYADKTIYNFTQMTQNLGKFTAAGLDLKTSKDAIQGIANLAAVNGAGAQEASRAMYQLSQAMSVGVVKAQDWNSVVNAGMSGDLFQNALIETAARGKKMVEVTKTVTNKAGKKIKKVQQMAIEDYVKEVGFKASLEKGWLTSDVLTEALQKFAGNKTFEEWTTLGYTPDQARAIMALGQDATDAATKVKTLSQLISTLKESAQSGWTETWELIIGNFDEAKELWTSMSDYFGGIIGKSAEARNQVVKDWKNLGGRDEMIKSFWNIVEAIHNVKEAIKEVIAEFVPEVTGESLKDMTVKFREFTDRILAFTQDFEKMNKVKDIFRGVASGLDFFKSIIVAVFNGIKKGLTGTDLGKTLLDTFSNFGQKITELVNRFKDSGSLEKITDGVATAVQKLVEVFQKAVAFFKGEDPGAESFEVVEDIQKSASLLDQAKDIFSKVTDFFQNSDATKGIKGFFEQLGVSLKNITSEDGKIDLGKVLLGIFGGTAFASVLKLIGDVRKMIHSAKDGVDGVADSISKTVESFKKKKVGTQNFATSVLEIAAAIALVAGAFWLIAQVDTDKMVAAGIVLGAITVALVAVSKYLGKMKATQAGKLAVVGVGLILFATSLLIMASALKKIAQLSPEQMVVGITGLGFVMLEIVGFLAILSKIKNLKAGKTIGVMLGVVLLAVSMNIMAKAVKTLGDLDTESIIRGIIGLGAVMLEIAAFLALTKNSKMQIGKALGILILGFAMQQFAKAMEGFASIDAEGIVKGLIGMGGVMLELIAFLNLTRGAKLGVFNAAGLLILAYTMKEFADTINVFAQIDTESLKQGLIGMGGVLLELGVFMRLVGKSKFGVLKSAGLWIFAKTLTTFIQDMQVLGSMDTESIVRGLVGMGAIMLEIAVFLNLVKGVNLSVLGFLGVICPALDKFVAAIQGIGQLKTEEVIRGVLGLGVVLLEIAAFYKIVQKSKFGLTSTASLILVAVAMVKFAEAIKMIGELETESVVKGVIGLGLVMLEIGIFTKYAEGMGILSAASLILIAQAMIGFGKAISDIGSLDIATILKGVVGLGAVMAEVALFVKSLKAAKMGASAIVGVIALAVGMRIMAEALIVVGQLDVVSAATAVASMGVVMTEISAFLKATSTTSWGGIAKIIVSAVVALGMMIAFAEVVKSLKDVKIETMVGFAASFGGTLLAVVGSLAIVSAIPFSAILLGIAKLAVVITAIAGVMALLGAAEKEWNVSSYIDSFGNIMESIGSAFGRLIGGFVSGLFSNFGEIGSQLGAFMTNATPFFDGVKRIDGTALEGVKNLTAALTAIAGANIAEAITQWLTGRSSVETFVSDITKLGEGLAAYANSVNGISGGEGSGLDESVRIATSLNELTKALPDTGGLVQWIAGAKDLGGFAEDIPILGSALKSYSDSVSGLKSNEADLQSAQFTAAGLVNLLEAIPATGGWAQNITGVPTLASVAGDIPKLGTALKAYTTYVSGFESSYGDSSAAQSIAEGLVGLLKKIPATGGLAQNIKGVPTLASVSGDIPKLGTALKAYVTYIGGIDESAADATTAQVIASGLVGLLEKIPATGGWMDNISGVPKLSSVAGDLPGLGTALRAYGTYITGLNENATDASVAQSIMEGLVGLIDKVPATGGLMAKITGVKNLGQFSEDNFEKVGAALKAYQTHISGISGSAGDATVAKEITEGLIGLLDKIPETGGWIQGITGAKELGKFAEEDITKLGKALNEYAGAIKGIKKVDSKDTKAAIDITTGLADLAKVLPDTGGILQLFMGAKSLGNLADDMPKLGKSLKAYAEHLSGFSKTVTTTDTENAISTANGIAELATKLPKEGGWLQTIVGFTDLEKFSKNVTDLGLGLKSFALNVGGIDKTQSETAVEVMGMIRDFATGLDDTGGVMQAIEGFFKGEQDPVGHTKKMAEMGENLATFANNISGIDTSDAEKATKVMGMIQEFVNGLSTEGGIGNLISGLVNGNQDIVSFSQKVAAFGTNFKIFTDGISDAPIAEYEFATVATLLEELKKFGAEASGFVEAFESDDFYSAQSMLTEFGTSIKQFGTDIAGTNAEQLAYAAVAIDHLVDIADKAAGINGSGVDKIIQVFKDYAEAGVGSLIDTLMNSKTETADAAGVVADGLESANGDYKDAGSANGEQYTNGLQNGIKSASPEVRGTAEQVASSAVRGIRSTRSLWVDAGAFLCQGLANGIRNNSSVVSEAAAAVARKAINSSKSILQEKSPSRVFYEIGKFVDLGMANGINKYSDRVSGSTEDVAKQSINNAQMVLARFSTSLSEGMDTTPVIRPVVDLSGARAGAAAIDGMFASERSLSGGLFAGQTFARNARSVNIDNARISGSGGQDVVGAINSLNERFDNLSNAVKNMQIVTETGVLVGAISEKMDRSLGIMAGRRNRGN